MFDLFQKSQKLNTGKLFKRVRQLEDITYNDWRFGYYNRRHYQAKPKVKSDFYNKSCSFCLKYGHTEEKCWSKEKTEKEVSKHTFATHDNADNSQEELSKDEIDSSGEISSKPIEE